MSELMAEMPLTHPLRAAWEAYKLTDEYKNTRKWAAHPDHLEGSLWGVWLAAFNAATERAASLHESVQTHCSHEPAAGAGAMGAVINYRDMIRSDTV
jgi:hypothetical protein